MSLACKHIQVNEFVMERTTRPYKQKHMVPFKKEEEKNLKKQVTWKSRRYVHLDNVRNHSVTFATSRIRHSLNLQLSIAERDNSEEALINLTRIVTSIKDVTLTDAYTFLMFIFYNDSIKNIFMYLCRIAHES